MKLPPLPLLHNTLRRITERLAGELAAPAGVAPQWSELEWSLARAVAAMHGVSSLLATRCKWNGPPDWQPFLLSQRAHVVNRHRRIEDVLTLLDARAREQQIALVALKGAALHSLGLYRPGDRPMADIDLLAHPRDVARAAELLESLGYSDVPASGNWKHRVFMPRVRNMPAQWGEHAQNYIKLELHERIAEILPLRPCDVTAAVYPRQPHPGLNAYPSTAALLIHLLIHASSNMAYRALRLIHLHDIALVAARMSPCDWEELLAHGRDCGGPWWALPPLQLTGRYYPKAAPPQVLAQLQDHCQWSLRRLSGRQTLSAVSLSYLWIEAFPGIGWSRSLTEMLECVQSRIRPNAEMRRLRRALAETEVAASHSDWSRLTQRQRILRWLSSRQPRPDTLHAVRMALAPPQ